MDSCNIYSNATAVAWALSMKEKFLIYWAIYFPTLTYDHKLWVVTKKWDHKYKQLKLASSEGCLGSPLEMGLELGHAEGTEIRAFTPPYQKEPIQVLRASDLLSII